jgi:hypothetical protein
MDFLLSRFGQISERTGDDPQARSRAFSRRPLEPQGCQYIVFPKL